MIDCNDNMYWAVDSLIEKNNITTCSSNITFRKFNAKAYEFEKVYNDKQSLTKYLRLTLVFMPNSALWVKFNFGFSRVFCYY